MELGIGVESLRKLVESLRKWVQQAEFDSGVTMGTSMKATTSPIDRRARFR